MTQSELDQRKNVLIHFLNNNLSIGVIKLEDDFLDQPAVAPLTYVLLENIQINIEYEKQKRETSVEEFKKIEFFETESKEGIFKVIKEGDNKALVELEKEIEYHLETLNQLIQ